MLLNILQKVKTFFLRNPFVGDILKVVVLLLAFILLYKIGVNAVAALMFVLSMAMLLMLNSAEIAVFGMAIGVAMLVALLWGIDNVYESLGNFLFSVFLSLGAKIFLEVFSRHAK